MPRLAHAAGDPEIPRGIPIGTYPTYLKAQEAVDYLSDHEFPVENVTIVGTDLRLVERVTGGSPAARWSARRPRPGRCGACSWAA